MFLSVLHHRIPVACTYGTSLQPETSKIRTKKAPDCGGRTQAIPEARGPVLAQAAHPAPALCPSCSDSFVPSWSTYLIIRHEALS